MMSHLQKHIVLVGLMGTGKTTLGRLLAQQLDTAFYDSDHVIEQAENRTISELFANDGETYFRDLEATVIDGLFAKPPSIIATGGGAFAQEKTRHIINETGVSVWLHAPIHMLLDRLAGKHSHRPMLKDKDGKEHSRTHQKELLQTLYMNRKAAYEKAHIHLDLAVDNIADGVKLLHDALQEYGVIHATA